MARLLSLFYQPVVAEEPVKTTSKRAWTLEEDTLLIEAVKREGAHNWAVIARSLNGGRKDKQCRERWFNHLCPDVKKGSWTPDEDEIILKSVAEMGTSWCRIAQLLPGRTDHAIKNRYYSATRRHRPRRPKAIGSLGACGDGAMHVCVNGSEGRLMPVAIPIQAMPFGHSPHATLVGSMAPPGGCGGAVAGPSPQQCGAAYGPPPWANGGAGFKPGALPPMQMGAPVPSFQHQLPPIGWSADSLSAAQGAAPGNGPSSSFHGAMAQGVPQPMHGGAMPFGSYGAPPGQAAGSYYGHGQSAPSGYAGGYGCGYGDYSPGPPPMAQPPWAVAPQMGAGPSQPAQPMQPPGAQYVNTQQPAAIDQPQCYASYSPTRPASQGEREN